MGAYWITCPTCGEKRDASGRYTSPANAAKDRRAWELVHGARRCADSGS